MLLGVHNSEDADGSHTEVTAQAREFKSRFATLGAAREGAGETRQSAQINPDAPAAIRRKKTKVLLCHVTRYYYSYIPFYAQTLLE